MFKPMLEKAELSIQILAPTSLMITLIRGRVHLPKSHFLTFTLGIIMLLISYDYYNDTEGNVFKVNI